MSAQLAEQHIAAQEQVRRQTAAAVARSWAALPGYDRVDIPKFLGSAVLIVTAGQRRSVALTNAFLARATGRPPLPLNSAQLTGAAVRAGTSPEDVYTRPFITVWSALNDGTRYEAAVAAGEHRATSAAAMDVQLSMRQTLVAVGQADERILGYARVPDAGACEFCRLVAGQRYTTDQLMPVHNHCGCGVDVITAENRHEYAGKPANDLSVTRDGVTAAVAEHGELGPLLVNGDDHFTALTRAA